MLQVYALREVAALKERVFWHPVNFGNNRNLRKRSFFEQEEFFSKGDFFRVAYRSYNSVRHGAARHGEANPELS